MKNFIKKTWWRVVMLLTLQQVTFIDKEMINRTKDDRTTYCMTKELAFKDEMPIFRELEYYSRISKMTPEEYKEYQANLKRERDNYAVMQGEYNKGKAEGKAEEKKQNAKAMKEYGVPFEIIAKGFNLTLEEIQNL